MARSLELGANCHPSGPPVPAQWALWGSQRSHLIMWPSSTHRCQGSAGVGSARGAG